MGVSRIKRDKKQDYTRVSRGTKIYYRLQGLVGLDIEIKTVNNTLGLFIDWWT